MDIRNFIFQFSCNVKVEPHWPSKGQQVHGPSVCTHFPLPGCVETLITDLYMQWFLLSSFKGTHTDTSVLEYILS